MYFDTTCSTIEPISVWKMDSSVLQVVTKYIFLIQSISPFKSLQSNPLHVL